MAISAGAAIIGGGLVAAEVVAAATLMYVGMAASVVGMLTKEPTLTKIGTGLGLAGGVASLTGVGASGSGAAGAELAAEASGAPATTEALSQTPAVTGAAAPAEIVQSQNLADAGVSSGASMAGGATAEGASVATTPLAGTADLAGGAGGLVESTAGMAGTDPIGGYAINDITPMIGEMANAPQIGLQGSAAPGLQSAGAWMGPSAGDIPAASYVQGGALDGATKGMWSSITDWFGNLSPSGKLAVGQTASGLVSGVGKGVFDYSAAQERNALEQQRLDLLRQQQARQQANLSGMAPRIGMQFNPTANLYPNGMFAPVGIINRARA